MKERHGLSRERLILSVLIAIGVWAWIFGSIAFALVLVISILIHEYGHYWWMGKEGIENRDMMMLPPLGAVAITREGWPNYGAEARIGVAGPALGFIPVAIFGVLYAATSSPMWAASTWIAAAINLFNLLPILPLDGGRIAHALFDSFFFPKFKSGWYAASAILLIALYIIMGFNLVIILMSAFLYWEFSSIRNARATVKENAVLIKDVSENEWQAMCGFITTIPCSEELKEKVIGDLTKKVEETRKANKMLSLEPMHGKQRVHVVLLYLAVALLHGGALYFATATHIPINLENIHTFFP